MNSTATKNLGVKYNTDSELEKWRVDTLLEKEPETIAWIHDYAAMGGVFFDIGANVGIYSLYASSLNPQLSVYSFEPVLNNFIALQNNIRLNKSSNCCAFQIALSNKTCLTELFIKDSRVGNSGAQIGRPIDEFGNMFECVEKNSVLGLSVDSLVYEFGFPAPSFIKIDVDGHEPDILLGMKQVLANEQPLSLLVEFNSLASASEHQSILASYGLLPDQRYNELPDHSKNRRAEKGSAAMNFIYTKG